MQGYDTCSGSTACSACYHDNVMQKQRQRILAEGTGKSAMNAEEAHKAFGHLGAVADGVGIPQPAEPTDDEVLAAWSAACKREGTSWCDKIRAMLKQFAGTDGVGGRSE